MIYRVRHTTTYTYAPPVPHARHVIRMLPVSRPGIDVVEGRIVVEPRPDETKESEDYFGNRVLRVSVETPHSVLAVESRCVVEVAPSLLPDPSTTPTVAAVRAALERKARLDGRAASHHVFPSRLVPLDRDIRDYAARSVTEQRPVLAAMLELNERIRADFAYDPTATDVTTPIAAAFAKRRGVCQDFAHIMISGLRSLGLPAAYVSGYLRTLPPPGKPRLVGADAMPAWVAVWCGPEIRWVCLDPTNGVPTTSSHVEVAFGRDYADAAPIDGVIVASGRQTLAVSVDMVEIDPAEARPAAGR